MSVSSLQVLADKRDALLLAEVAAWLHDVGKFCNVHIETHSRGGKQRWSNSHAYKVVVDQPQKHIHLSKQAHNLSKPDSLKNVLSATSPKAADYLPQVAKDVLAETKVSLLGQTYSLAELIMLGTPGFATHGNRARLLCGKDGWLAAVLGVCHKEAHHDKQEPARGEGIQTWPDVFISSAFGYEWKKVVTDSGSPDYPDKRLQNLPWSELRFSRVQEFADSLDDGLGDTRRPINEVTLADWSATVAALYKSAMATWVLEDQKGREREIRKMHKDYLIDHDLRWRLLRVNFDVLGLYAKAIKIADLLVYQDAVNIACESVKELVEKEYPLGNEVYRDTTGMYFTFPDIGLPADLAQEICRRIEEVELELAPRICVEQPPGATATEQLKRMLGDGRGKALKELEHPFNSNNFASSWQQLWENLPDGKWELCPVCRLRPMREVREACETCLNRRKSRIQWWEDHPQQTIWMDEIGDHNDRVALIVGKFGLDEWLSGDLVQTMLVKVVENNPSQCIPKNPSFARLRRVWETCRRFWTGTVTEEIMAKHRYGKGTGNVGLRCVRLSLIPDKKDGWKESVPYDGTVNGQAISLIWREDSKEFVTISNLQLVAGDATTEDEVVQQWKGQRIILGDPDDPSRKIEFTVQKVKPAEENFRIYQPYLPLLALPDQFLALVPAAEALDIAEQIKSEYETQMSKVQNRLPLFVGIVFFQRKMPLMAAMDTARRMLGQVKLGEEKWQVECNSPDGSDSKRYLCLSLKDKRIEWSILTKMGDNTTEDIWYPYFFVEHFADGTSDNRKHCFLYNGRWLVHVKDLQPGDFISVTFSRFAYFFLDTTARRFQFDPKRDAMLLGELPHLREMWQAICKSDITDTKLQGIHALFESKRREWKLGEPTIEDPITDGTFRYLVESTLKRDNVQGVTVEDVLNGRFRRCLDLYAHILKRRVSDAGKEGEQNEPETV